MHVANIHNFDQLSTPISGGAVKFTQYHYSGNPEEKKGALSHYFNIKRSDFELFDKNPKSP